MPERMDTEKPFMTATQLERVCRHVMVRLQKGHRYFMDASEPKSNHEGSRDEEIPLKTIRTVI